MELAELQKKLASISQSHVLRFWDELSPAQRDRLKNQIERLDLDSLDDLIEKNVRHKPDAAIPANLQPVEAYPHHPTSPHEQLYQRAFEHGETLLKQGKVGAFLVAGGQGTRLGYDGPKGEYPVTPIRKKPLFQVFAEQLLAASRDAGRIVPWYIMTSEVNDAPTRAFFKKHHNFGYDPENIFFFSQGMMPAFARDGSILLADRDSLALSPDGHGGSLRALWKSGAVADMQRRGVEHLSYFQVDNPLVHCIDPLFLGLHDLAGSEMSSKTISKAHALEKVGNFVLVDGVLQVIEYSDLPDDVAQQVNADGTLKFNAGSIAIHILRVSFIERLNRGGKLSLPWHRAEKKVPYIDEHGKLIAPNEPNAIKLEQFVFDAIPLAKNPIVYTTDRDEEFSPVKNAQGADSPETCRRDQIRRAMRWLKQAGIQVPLRDREPDAVIEISPLYARTARHLCSRKPAVSIPAGANIHLGENGVE